MEKACGAAGFAVVHDGQMLQMLTARVGSDKFEKVSSPALFAAIAFLGRGVTDRLTKPRMRGWRTPDLQMQWRIFQAVLKEVGVAGHWLVG